MYLAGSWDMLPLKVYLFDCLFVNLFRAALRVMDGESGEES